MSKVVLILGATTVGLGLASLHLVNQLREGNATIAELQEKVAALEKQEPVATTPIFSVMPTDSIAAAAVVQSAPRKEEPKVATRAAGQASVASPVPTHLPGREDAMRAMREHRERERQLMQDPEYREAMRLQTRNNLARQYPGVAEELGLDRRQADEFFGMLADQQMRTNETMNPFWEMQPPGENPDPAAMQERQRNFQQTAAEMQRKNEAELVARFGQEKAQAWKEYQSTMGMRFHLDDMRSTLAAQGVPLNEELSKPVLKALAEAQKAELEAYNATARQNAAGSQRLAAGVAFESTNMDWHIEHTKKRNQRMLDAIAPYLTYEQRTAIEKQQQAQVKLQEAQMRLMRERGDSNQIRGFFSGSGSVQLTPVQP
ncbi:hypothetical protein JM946_05760 [Steroidobacter sp. S1-65]|uniref:Uncharacterized protein n=1 Tax=Steroidobacter gossypii TaxID=2805490 RepID=A0ABS1WTE2_9GAMM|nr:hypothetical protein [Steroidobacter gossypii]MBM0104240.1 hypothetical protein [Steroidobacter gossypii]